MLILSITIAGETFVFAKYSQDSSRIYQTEKDPIKSFDEVLKKIATPYIDYYQKQLLNSKDDIDVLARIVFTNALGAVRKKMGYEHIVYSYIHTYLPVISTSINDCSISDLQSHMIDEMIKYVYNEGIIPINLNAESLLTDSTYREAQKELERVLQELGEFVKSNSIQIQDRAGEEVNALSSAFSDLPNYVLNTIRTALFQNAEYPSLKEEIVKKIRTYFTDNWELYLLGGLPKMSLRNFYQSIPRETIIRIILDFGEKNPVSFENLVNLVGRFCLKEDLSSYTREEIYKELSSAYYNVINMSTKILNTSPFSTPDSPNTHQFRILPHNHNNDNKIQ